MLELVLAMKGIKEDWCVEHYEKNNTAAWHIVILSTRQRSVALAKYNDLCAQFINTNWELVSYCDDYRAMSTVFVAKKASPMTTLWGIV